VRNIKRSHSQQKFPNWLENYSCYKKTLTCAPTNELLDVIPLSVEEHERGVFLQKKEHIFRHSDVNMIVGVGVNHPPVDYNQCHDEDEDYLRSGCADADDLRVQRLLFLQGPQPCEAQKIQCGFQFHDRDATIAPKIIKEK
jgi:hypothetical protein